MGRTNKIVAYQLEHLVLTGRSEALTIEQIQENLNAALKRRGIQDQVSRATLCRYIKEAGTAATAVAYRTEVVEEQLGIVINIGHRVRQNLERLDTFLAFAEVERDQHGQRQYGPIVQLTAEIRQQTRLYADLLDRLYSAQRVAIFQQAVLDAIDEADPETADRVRTNLRKHHEIRRAALVGA